MLAHLKRQKEKKRNIKYIKRHKRKKDIKEKRRLVQKDKRLKIKRLKGQKDKRQGPKREFNIVTSGQFCTLAMFYHSTTLSGLQF